MFTRGYIEPVLPMIANLGPWGFWLTQEALNSGAPAAAAWESGNRAVYTPLHVPTTCICRRVWWANGATVSGGATIAVGVYADAGLQPGAKLVSGSAVQGSASQVQLVDVTDTVIPPGINWLAIMMTSTTNTSGMR